MKAFLFPGQGSQVKGMGRELFKEYKDLVIKADDILGYSIEELCLEDKNDQLRETQFTQPALFIVNALAYLQRTRLEGRVPSYVAGHSLGEYNALFAAGVFDFETGVKLVQKRGELMSQAPLGGMAAVIGLDEEQVMDVIKKLKNVYIANFNSPSQIVISGERTEITGARPFFFDMDALYIVLNVSGAFHTIYMEESKQKFREFINGFEFANPKIPVIANLTARPYKSGDIKEILAMQITNPVKWTESIRYLMGKGEMEFIQIGPGNTISRLVSSIQKEAEPLIIKDDVTTAIPPLPPFLLGNQEPKTTDIEAVINEATPTPTLTATISACSLGSDEFKKDYNLKYAYLAGAMYKGVSSKEMVVKLGKSGLMGYLGTGGLDLNAIEEALRYIQQELNSEQAYGLNLLNNPDNPEKVEKFVDMLLEYEVRNIEASAFISATPSLVRFRLKGLKRNHDGVISATNRVMGKVSRPEVAEMFLSPAPEKIVTKLLAGNVITAEQAEWARAIPMADDICVEADSGGHTDGGVMHALLPAIIKLRDEMAKKYKYDKLVRVGAAGGIGTPEAAAAAFILGADFILTGSINQCTVESGASDLVKDLLQQINVQDTEYAPAGDMFELGAKVQVLKKGVFFPARANKLYELYRHYNSLDEIDDKTRKQLQEKYFKRSFESIYEECKKFYSSDVIEKAKKNAKHKMALIFRWYFGYSTRLAMEGNKENKVDFQVHCGPALGAFNQWVKGTRLESWKHRYVDELAEKLMNETAEVLSQRFQSFR